MKSVCKKTLNIKTCPNHISVKYILDATHRTAAKPKIIVQKWKEGNSQCQASQPSLEFVHACHSFQDTFWVLWQKSSSWRRPRGRFQGHAHEIVVTFRVNGSVTQRKGITFFYFAKKNRSELFCEIFLLQLQLYRSPCKQQDLLRCPWDRRQHIPPLSLKAAF